MLRHCLRPMLLSLLLACGLLGLVASGSQAANFTASSYPALITGVSIEGVETEAGNSIEDETFELAVGFWCKSSFSSTLTSASSILEAEVTFSKCQAGLGTVSVNTTGCKFKYHLEEGSVDDFTGSLDLVCPVGAAVDIEIPAIGCTMTIPPQTGLKKVHFHNETAKGDITVQAEVSGALHYTVAKGGVFCGATGERTNGSYREIKPVTLSSTGKTVDVG